MQTNNIQNATISATIIRKNGTRKVEEMDFIKLFEEKLESDKWLNELENAKYERLEIELN